MEYYPTLLHKKAADKMVEIFSKDKLVMSILLTCSCARGKASKDSCLDMCLVVDQKKNIKAIRDKFEAIKKEIKELINIRNAGVFAHIDLDITDGKIPMTKRGWTSGPDSYELQIGNLFVYSKILFDRNKYFEKMKEKYLPYYTENIR
jgi:predicted nucleotidyltransferase